MSNLSINTIADLEEWLRATPNGANYIWHDPTAELRDFQNHNSLLHLAVLGYWDHLGSSTRLVELLLNAGANPNIQNDDGDTPLHYACQIDTRSPTIVETLLRYGADHTILNHRGWSPLNLAAGMGELSKQIAELLINHGANFDLNSAIQLGRIEDAIRLFQLHGLAQASFPDRVLVDAIGTGSPQFVEMLLKHSHQAGKELSPEVLCRAIEVNQAEIVRLLLENGADPQAKCDGVSVDEYAEQLERDPAIVQLLRQAIHNRR